MDLATKVEMVTHLVSEHLVEIIIVISLRIPMKTATHSDSFRPLIPIQSGHFGAWSVWRA